jgi:glycerophosphoryl diester phosphodiesterase
MGFRYLETDVHATADGHLVAFHDDHLDRVTDARGRVAELTLAQVREARIAGRAPIPLLSELLEALPQARVNIDPKHDAAVAPLAALIKQMRATDRVCVGSFSAKRTGAVARLVGSELCTALGPTAVARIRLGGGAVGSVVGDCAQVPARAGPLAVVTRTFVERVHALGKVVHVWTVDHADEMHRLLDLGVDGIMTDRPMVLRSVLQARGQWSN